MANIKLFGNTKIQGNVLINIQEEAVPFSPDQIAGLRGWYDANEGVYSSNGNDAVDDEYAYVSYWSYGSGNIQTAPQSLINGKKSYGGGSLRWENNAWILTYLSSTGDDGDQYDTTIASGDTQYPWQANWSGSNNAVTRVATVNSMPATVNQTVAKWKNKVGILANIYSGHLVQANYSNQPVLRANYGSGTKKGIEFTSDTMNGQFTESTSQQRTYYMVAANQNTLGATFVLAPHYTSGNSSRRSALVYNGTYGLSQGGSASGNKYSGINMNGGSHIVCASFDAISTGKIRVKSPFGDSEVTLTGLATNWDNVYSELYVGSGTQGATVNIFEILVYEGAHTTEQKNQVINYLTTKHSDLSL
jgi:hypothetical protein